MQGPWRERRPALTSSSVCGLESPWRRLLSPTPAPPCSSTLSRARSTSTGSLCHRKGQCRLFISMGTVHQPTELVLVLQPSPMQQAAEGWAEGRPLPNTSQWLAELQSTPPPVLWIFETNQICILCQAPTTLMASVYLPLLSPPDSKINDLLFIHSGGKRIHTLSLHTGPVLQWGSAFVPFECISPT